MAAVKKLESGLWQAQVRMNGVRASKTKATKVEVKDWAAQKEYEIRTLRERKKRQSHLVRQRSVTNLSSARLSGGEVGIGPN